MSGSAYPDVLHEGINPIVIKSRSVPAGTFLLRRAHYLKEIEQEMLLSAEQRQALLNLVKADNLDAKKKMIDHYMRLVAGIAMSYANHGVEFLVLVRKGTTGLIHALENFDLAGSLFWVYAKRCIRERIERVILTSNCQASAFPVC